MSRILVAVLIVSSVLVSALERKSVAGATLQGGRPMHVTVSFDGLMVFHNEGGSSGYKVGIHSRAMGHHHTFRVLADGVPKTVTTARPGEPWTLSVTNSTGPGVVTASLGRDRTRMSDDHDPSGVSTTRGQYDFDWIINLSDFHSGLRFNGGMLTPIIHVTEGIIYSRYKADLMRRKGAGTFGFFTETVALDIQLTNRQSLILSVDGGGRTILRIDYSATEPSHEVAIENTRDDPGQDSDFDEYYNLFEPIADAHYDFEPDSSNPPRPNNGVPRPRLLSTEMRTNQKRMKPKEKKLGSSQVSPFTCCGLKCNAIEVNIPLR